MSEIFWCRNCVYPSNAKPTITFDDNGICSGCKYNFDRDSGLIDWKKKEEELGQILFNYSELARQNGADYDCLIPVSGGKDSHFQVWLVKEKFGLNPLLVHFNHNFNTGAGLRNLENLKKVSGCDLVICSMEPEIVRKVAREMTLRIGDITWHYHAGIMTAPFKIAVEKKIPLIIWGEHGFGELTGVVSLLDLPEFTNWKRKQYDMRGVNPESLSRQLELKDGALDVLSFPSREELEEFEIRGIYLSNYLKWNALEHAMEMKEKYNFAPVTYKRERTFNLYSKIEDHANDVHDYLKFLKFGYGRATDDASMEIRHRRISRKTALSLVQEYDSNEPSTLGYYLDYLEIPRNEFFERLNPQRDKAVWEARGNSWRIRSSHVENFSRQFHEAGNGKDEIFDSHYNGMYYFDASPPRPVGDSRLDSPSPSPYAGNS